MIEQIGMGPTAFGWLTFFGCGIPYVLAGYSNGKLVKHYGTVFMMRFGWGIAAFAGLLMLLGYFIAEVNIWVIMLPLALFNFGLTFIWPNAFAEAFTPFGHIAGYAGALYGFMQICGGAALSGLISYLPEKTQLGYAIMLIFCSLTAWLVFEIARKYQS